MERYDSEFAATTLYLKRSDISGWVYSRPTSELSGSTPPNTTNVVYQYLAHISTSRTFPDPYHFGIQLNNHNILN